MSDSGDEGPMRITVIVPSYRRTDRLAACLNGLEASDRRPDEVLVVLRPDDRESITLVGGRAEPVRRVEVTHTGVLAAMAAGVAAASGDVIAFIDDDAVVHPDWLTKIAEHLGTPSVGGVGGRDIVTNPDDLPRLPVAGMVGHWGRVIGNHHTVTGAPRRVDVLKGADMAFRREALALPHGLLGKGAEVHHEVAICLHARNQGWELVLDPAAEVLHLPGRRFDPDRRGNPSAWSAHWRSFNLTWCLLTMRPELTLRRLAYGLLVGDRPAPGLVRAAVAIVRREPEVLATLVPSILGQLRAVLYLACGRPVPMQPAPPLAQPSAWSALRASSA
jgi:GT2 family glycosyltransferase